MQLIWLCVTLQAIQEVRDDGLIAESNSAVEEKNCSWNDVLRRRRVLSLAAGKWSICFILSLSSSIATGLQSSGSRSHYGRKFD